MEHSRIADDLTVNPPRKSRRWVFSSAPCDAVRRFVRIDGFAPDKAPHSFLCWCLDRDKEEAHFRLEDQWVAVRHQHSDVPAVSRISSRDNPSLERMSAQLGKCLAASGAVLGA